MDKRYMDNPAMMAPGNATNYSMPEEKQTEGSFFPEMNVRQHRVLPHLRGRRAYQSAMTPEGANQPPYSTERATEQTQMPDTNTAISPGIKSPQTETKKSTTLDLNSVPRPNIQTEENTVKGIQYSAKPQLPNLIPCPSATTRYFSYDEGNSIPRMFRCTTQCILTDGTTFLNSSLFSLGAIVQPFAELSEYEYPVPLSKGGGDELFRCNRCGAYVNPGFTFVDGGSSVRCNLCEGLTPLSVQNLVQETDKTRAEFTLGTYDFIAPTKLAGKKVTGNNLLLLIECTHNAVNFGNCLFY
jgi:protein transport protein SEC24